MNDIITQAITVCSLIISIAAVVGLVASAVKKAKTPEALQNQRLDELEKAVKKHDELFLNDLRRFESMEAGNKIMLECMLALLSHSIDGNDIDGMKAARKNLNQYLISH